VVVIGQDSEAIANRNMHNGAEPTLGVIGDLLPGSPTCVRAGAGW